MQDIANRMKENYEFPSKNKLTRRIPVIIRVDGKAFHTYTKGMERPFDNVLHNAMCNAACHVMRTSQGCKLAYVQSDEASFLFTDYDQLSTCAWFDYNKSKIESVSASVMTAHFNNAIRDHLENTGMSGRVAYFDSRAFNMPREEVVNYFLWRAMDWARNSLSMYCNHFYSAKEMHGKSAAEQHQMLYEKGANWTLDLTDRQKNGTWIYGIKQTGKIQPVYSDIQSVINPMIYMDQP